MEILSNPAFWIILATIVFILAIIGFLTDGLNKQKKEKSNKEEPKMANTTTNEVEKDVTTENLVETPVENPVETKTDDWTVMPEVNTPLEEVKVDTIEEIPSEPTSEPLFNEPVISALPETESVVETPVETLNENPTEQVVETPVESLNKNSTEQVESLSFDTPVETLSAPTPAETEISEVPTENSNDNNDIWNA